MINLKIISEPSIEPITLLELKEHLRINSEDYADTITPEQSIAPDSYSAATQTGTGVDRDGKNALIQLNVGEIGASTTLDVTIQESDDNITYANWSDSNLSQVTDSNDNQIFEQEYTGIKQYIRCVGVVAGSNNADYSATVILQEYVSQEDTQLNNYIKAARELIEKISNYKFITQTIELSLDEWPAEDRMCLQFSPIQSVTSVKYFLTDDTETTFSSDNYNLNDYAEPGFIYLDFNGQWPTSTLRPSDAIRVRFVAGYGDNTTDVPERWRQVIKEMAGHLYENRELTVDRRMYEIALGLLHQMVDRDVVL